MNEILLQCKKLCKYYQEGSIRTDVLHNVCFSIKQGEMIAILGNSGSGKSTLLHLLGGLDTPTSGDIFFSGKALSAMSSSEKSKLRNRELGFIYQMHHLLLDFTVLENVAMPLLIRKKKLSEITTCAKTVLKAVGLSHRINYWPSELSGGERQRVAIARALINKPRLVLADEPTGNLDTSNANKICQLLEEMNAMHGTSFLVVTHDLQVARRMNRQLKIRDGNVVTDLSRIRGNK